MDCGNECFITEDDECCVLSPQSNGTVVLMEVRIQAEPRATLL